MLRQHSLFTPDTHTAALTHLRNVSRVIAFSERIVLQAVLLVKSTHQLQ
jgi:hypothetical protein